METRDNQIIALREAPIGIITEFSSEEERFQNQTLRPIIKFQNDLFIAVFRNHISKHKNDFHLMSAEKKLQYVDNAIQRDIKFRNALKGIIIGLFSMEEFERYIKNSSALNKRMMNIVTERLKSQVQLFDLSAAQ